MRVTELLFLGAASIAAVSAAPADAAVNYGSESSWWDNVKWSWRMLDYGKYANYGNACPKTSSKVSTLTSDSTLLSLHLPRPAAPPLIVLPLPLPWRATDRTDRTVVTKASVKLPRSQQLSSTTKTMAVSQDPSSPLWFKLRSFRDSDRNFRLRQLRPVWFISHIFHQLRQLCKLHPNSRPHRVF